MYESPGRVTIAPGVLVTIARLTTLSVPGVTRMVPRGIPALLRHGWNEGVLLEVEGGRVRFDLFIVADANANLRQVGQKIQAEVARATRDMVGMDVEAINVHIQDVAYPELAYDVECAPVADQVT
jgi:uncharacterized alkaline shock family protein YloU